MLDVTTNNQQASANINYCGYGIADDLDLAAELLDEDMMDPLFDEDWLHENNLDILFELFEEEIESKVTVDSNNGSSALFGTSPITSYLFGTSPSLASTLDLLYLDNQQQTNGSSTTSQQQPSVAVTNANTVDPNYNSVSGVRPTTFSVKGSRSSNQGNAQQVGVQQGATSHPTNTLTNSMRIKRGLKRGQSEGVSLLAKPSSSSSARVVCSSSSGSSSGGVSKSASNKLDKSCSKIINKNNSDKTSAKITNFKNSIIIGNQNNYLNNRNGIDINYSKQSSHLKRERVYLHNCQHHIHQITGRAIMHEHAYAVRGH